MVPVRSEDPVQKSCTAHEWCAPCPCAGLLAGRPACGYDGHFARRRALCSRCTPLVSEPRLPASSHACEHAMLMLTCARAYVLAGVRSRQVLASAATSQRLQQASMAHGDGVWVCCSRGARATAVRRLRASRLMTSLSGTVSRMLREVMFASPVWSCVLLCVSQPASSWPASSVVIAGTVGCSAVRFLAILGSRNNFSFFGPSVAATRLDTRRGVSPMRGVVATLCVS